MLPLHTLSDRRWSLDAFVDQANALLPAYLPSAPVNSRVKGEVNARLVRHYTGQGLLEEPLKEGREARYRYRHLLQLLLVRRLLAEGLSAGAIGNLVRKKGEIELEGILEGGATVEVSATLAAPGQSALAFLADLRAGEPPVPAPAPTRKRQRPAPQAGDAPASREVASSDVALQDSSIPDAAGPTPDTFDPAPEPRTDTGQRPETTWVHHTITDGLQLHVRSDFRAPDSPKARHNLLALIEQRLKRRGRR
jgi:DNA-binding transcriptional MerR regulator